MGCNRDVLHLQTELEDISLSTPSEAQVLGKKSFGLSPLHHQHAVAASLPTIDHAALGSSRDTAVGDGVGWLRRASRRLCQMTTVLVTYAGIGGMLVVLFCSAIGIPKWLCEDAYVRSNVMSVLFLCGLALVALEDALGINKSAVMLLLAATSWTMLAESYDPIHSEVGRHQLHLELDRGLQDVASVILFLLPAMGVVESIDHFQGFQIVTQLIHVGMKGHKERVMPIMCLLVFFLSSVIDNLTATIVALKILRHVVTDDEDFRRECGGLVVIAANAGGAWSPIGDVTTTMLWIQGKITAPKTVLSLFFPSFVAGMAPLLGVCCQMRRRSGLSRDIHRGASRLQCSNQETGGDAEEGQANLEEEPLRPDLHSEGGDEITRQKVVSLCLGIFVILLVPMLKMGTGLPPYLGMLLALGLMWLLTDLLGFDSEAEAKGHVTVRRGVIAALFQVDLTGLLFFTGVLLSVGALDSAGVLRRYASYLVRSFGDSRVWLCTTLGISSAVVDNVPLVEAAIDMFKDVGTDDHLWQLVALAAGTGGSILSIGSIAGVTLMSMEGIGFLWYCKRVSLWAFLGFILGIGAYQLQCLITGR